MKKTSLVCFCLFMAFAFCLYSCANASNNDEPQLYEVTFETNGGSAVSSVKTNKVEKSPLCSKENADFMGWYDNAAFDGNSVVFPFVPTRNTTLYARWNQKYQVTFETNGGTGEIQDYVTDVVKTAPDIKKENYCFAGWYEAADFSGEPVQFPYTLSAKTTLYAKWLKICHVRFETNGGSLVADKNEAIINEAPVSTRTGWILLGWCKDRELQNQITFPYELTDDAIFYAKWTENTNILYKVEHYKQTKDLNSYNLVDIEKLAGETESVTHAVAKNYEGFEAKEFSQSAIAADGSTVIKIYYNRKKSKVIFNANGGTGTMPSQDFYYDVPKLLSSNTFSRAGYSFAGWATNADGEVVYHDSDSYCSTSADASDVNLYAVWAGEQVSYKVEHYKQTTNLGNNYELVNADTETIYGKSGTQTAAVAKTYTGFAAKAFSQEAIAGNGSTVIKVYYNREKYTVSFNANGGSGTMSTQEFYYGVSQTLNANAFERPNYCFAGWAESASGAAVYNNSQSVIFNEAKTLFAVWLYGAEVMDSTVGDLNLSNLTDAYTIKVVGNITNLTLKNLADKIKQANKDILLDLSGIEGLTTISSAENGCSSIFSSCEKLKTIILSGNLTSIGNYAFYRCNLTTVYIKNINSIGQYAFSCCENLKNVYLENLGEIEDYAFENCVSLTEIMIDALIVDSGAFQKCTTLSTVTIGQRVNKLYNNYNSSTDSGKVFGRCTSLQSVSFENTKNWKLSIYDDSLDVSNPARNAANLKGTFGQYVWYR